MAGARDHLPPRVWTGEGGLQETHSHFPLCRGASAFCHLNTKRGAIAGLNISTRPALAVLGRF